MVNYTYGLTKGSTTYGRLRGRLNTQQRWQKVSAIERHWSTTRGAIPWNNIHEGSLKGIHYTWAPSPAQGLTLAYTQVLTKSGALPHLTAESAGRTSIGFAVGN